MGRLIYWSGPGQRGICFSHWGLHHVHFMWWCLAVHVAPHGQMTYCYALWLCGATVLQWVGWGLSATDDVFVSWFEFYGLAPHHILMPVLSLCWNTKISPKVLIKYSDSDQDIAACLSFFIESVWECPSVNKLHRSKEGNRGYVFNVRKKKLLHCKCSHKPLTYEEPSFAELWLIFWKCFSKNCLFVFLRW